MFEEWKKVKEIGHFLNYTQIILGYISVTINWAM
jgi:hypothetical protein